MESSHALTGGFRLGLGELADPRGLMPRFLARGQYLEALFIECAESRTELASVWSSALVALVVTVRDQMDHDRPDDAEDADMDALAAFLASVPKDLSNVWERALAPIAERVLDLLCPNCGVSRAPERTESPHTRRDSEIIFEAMLRRSLHGHAAWMGRYELPRNDLGWCIVTSLWGLKAALDGDLPQGPISTSAAESPDSTPALALLDPQHMRPVYDAVARWTGHAAEEPDRPPFIALSAGGWFAGLIDTLFSHPVAGEPPVLEWNPFVETEAAAKARWLAEAERAATEHFAAVKARLTAAGAEPTAAKPSGLDHFRWLVRYQVHKQSMGVIAREVCRERQTVASAIDEIAALIGLPLREPSRGGRPRRAAA